MTRIRVPAGQVACDLHVHTLYSKDSLSSLRGLIDAVRRRGLSGLAITDHNNIEGALRLRDVAPFSVIVGEEIRTREGEIIGLFLENLIPRDLSPEDTVAAIRQQGGLVYLPHPADGARRSPMRRDGVGRVIGSVDIIEVFNARVLLASYNRRARRLADEHGLPHGAGSDAHAPAEVGEAYVLMPECDMGDARAFLEALRHSRAVGRMSGPLVHLSSTAAKVVKRLGLAGKLSLT